MPLNSTQQAAVKAGVDLDGLPRHVAIIMDGNGRWARHRGLPRIAGHRKGVETVVEVVGSARDLGVKALTLYAFSTENWSRPRAEVEALMTLLRQYLRGQLSRMLEGGVRLKAIGRVEELPRAVRGELARAEEATAGNDVMCLQLALNYGGRQEILDAVRSLAVEVAAGRLRPEDVDEERVASRLYTAGIPDPDLVIRTSGEMRLSNFLLWQASYAEFYVTDVLWPDFDEAELLAAIKSFQGRERRYGGVGGAEETE